MSKNYLFWAVRIRAFCFIERLANSCGGFSDCFMLRCRVGGIFVLPIDKSMWKFFTSLPEQKIENQ